VKEASESSVCELSIDSALNTVTN